MPCPYFDQGPGLCYDEMEVIQMPRKTVIALFAFIVLTLALLGCKPPEPPTPTKMPLPLPPSGGAKPEGVSVTWFGQSCFLFEDPAGTTVLIDPFNPDVVGYRDPGLRETEVDVVAVTHEHPDHNYLQLVKTAANTVRGPGNHQAGSILFKGIAASHGPQGGGTPDTIFTWQMGGINFCHLGDVGVMLTPDQVSQIGPVDVLFVPVGGYYTIDASVATQVVDALKPKIVIPMHYQTPMLSPSIAKVLAPADAFVQGKEQSPESEKHTVVLKKETLPQTTQVLVMKYE